MSKALDPSTHPECKDQIIACEAMLIGESLSNQGVASELPALEDLDKCIKAHYPDDTEAISQLDDLIQQIRSLPPEANLP